MKEIALDNSTAVFLAKLGLFPLLIKQGIKFITTPEIEEEIGIGMREGYRDASVRKQLIEDKKILIIPANAKTQIQKEYGITGADASIFALAKERGSMFATEDRTLQNLAKSQNIHVTTTGILLYALYIKKVIGKEQALMLCDLLEIYGYG